MERNRKILISILCLLVVSSVIAIVDISLKMQKRSERIALPFNAPETGPGIGVVRIEGAISMEAAGGPFGMVQSSDMIIDRLDELDADENIKAIVVRINSPGGTVGATQEIYQKVWKLRKKNRFLIASMGEMAASGGYYVASACNLIMANQGTITGSIGVIAAAPNLRGLFDKLGIRMNVIKSGRYKDILSGYRDITPDELMILQDLIDSSYKKFVKDVALGRNMGIADISPYADGRIMSGERALQYKLIDLLGTYEDALERARTEAKLPEGCPVYDESVSPLERFFMSLEGMLNRGNPVPQELLRGTGVNLIEYRYLP